MTCVFVGDTMCTLAQLGRLDLPTRDLHVPYGFAFLATAICALHPSMSRLTESRSNTGDAISKRRANLIVLALLVPAILLLEQQPDSLANRVVLFVVVAALSGAATLRIVQAMNAAQQSEKRLAFEATHDPLTGLANRRMMQTELEQFLNRDESSARQVALIFLDLDRFKLVNDAFGHTFGDEMLIEVANRLQLHTRCEDVVARLNGDAFVIITVRVASPADALALAGRLRDQVMRPMMIRGTEFHMSASLGVAMSPQSPTSAEHLYRDADIALHKAKHSGHAGAISLFEEGMHTSVAKTVELEHDLRRALYRDQFRLVYQPIVRLPRGPVEGLEALLRWHHPVHGLVSPAIFIPVAEESGLITDIGDWVLENAVRRLAYWRDRHLQMRDLHVAVNVSALQLHDDTFVERIDQLLSDNGLDGSALCLELTERVLMQNAVAESGVFEKLRGLGVCVAIDDFGTEYSSLSYLKRLPVSALKIDKSFVDDLALDDPSHWTLVSAMLDIAKAMGIMTVAEGVEHSVQAERLASMGCDAVQGYLFSRPVAGELVPELLKTMWGGRDVDGTRAHFTESVTERAVSSTGDTLNFGARPRRISQRVDRFQATSTPFPPS